MLHAGAWCSAQRSAACTNRLNFDFFDLCDLCELEGFGCWVIVLKPSWRNGFRCVFMNDYKINN